MGRKDSEISELYMLKSKMEYRDLLEEKLIDCQEKLNIIERKINTENIPIDPGCPYSEMFYEDLEERIGDVQRKFQTVTALFLALICLCSLFHPSFCKSKFDIILNSVLYLLYVFAYVSIRRYEKRSAWAFIAAACCFKITFAALEQDGFVVLFYVALVLLLLFLVFCLNDDAIETIVRRAARKIEIAVGLEDDAIASEYEVVKNAIIRANTERYSSEISQIKCEIVKIQYHISAVDTEINEYRDLPQKHKNAETVFHIIDLLESRVAENISHALSQIEE